MQLCVLHLDDALELQPDFINACEQAQARFISARDKGSELRLWGRPRELDTLRRNLAAQLSKGTASAPLCFMGSGDFHHVSSLLLPIALERQSAPVTLLHFDNHPDWVNFCKGTHCGSWVNRAAEHPQVAKIITIGVCSHDLRLPELKGANLDLLKEKLELYPYQHAPSRVRGQYGKTPSYEQIGNELHWKSINDMGEQNFIDHLLSRIPTESVYLTIDKDVLLRDDAITNWDQGRMHLPYLLSLIREISRRHRLIGADVTGDYSTPSYSGSLCTRLLKRGEIFLDQSHRKPDLGIAAHINSVANHALLEVLSEAMA